MTKFYILQETFGCREPGSALDLLDPVEANSPEEALYKHFTADDDLEDADLGAMPIEEFKDQCEGIDGSPDCFKLWGEEQCYWVGPTADQVKIAYANDKIENPTTGG